MSYILSMLPIAFVIVFTMISFMCVADRHPNAEQAWEEHIQQKKKREKMKRKEEPHEDP